MRRLALQIITIILHLPGLSCRRILRMPRCPRSIEHFRNLLQTVSLRFREQEERHHEENRQQNAEHNIVVPADVVQCDRVDEGEDDQRAVHGQQLDCETFAAERVGEDLSWVAQEERSVGDVVVEEEDEDEGDDDDACGLGAVLVEDGGAGGPDDEGDEHAGAGPDKERAAAEPVDEECGADGGAEVEDLEYAVDQGLGVWVGDADSVEDERQVVADNGNAVPLCKAADADGDEGSFAVAGGGDKSGPFGGFGFLLELDGA